MWSLLMSNFSFSSPTATEENTTQDRSPCENALITVLPLFAHKVKEAKILDNIDPVACHNDRARKLQSFCVQYEMEAGTLRDNLEDMVNWSSKSERNDSEEYKEALNDVLFLFEGQISSKVLEQVASIPRDFLALEDAVFPKLHALCSRKEITDRYYFKQIDALIHLPTKHLRRSAVLRQLETFNRYLDSLKEGPLYSETPQLEFEKTNPPYEVRKALDSLFHVLDSSWKLNCQDNSHETKLRLSTFGRGCVPRRKEDEDLMGRNFDVLFSTHTAPPRWIQSRINVIEGATHHSKASPVTWGKVSANSRNSANSRKSPREIDRPVAIHNLCAALNEPAVRKFCLLLSAECKETGFGENSLIGQMCKLPFGPDYPKYILSCDKRPTISLKELMDSMKNTNTNFTLKERRTLAVVLAHAMLHICESSWLEKELKKENISFLQTQAKADLRRPYLTVEFPKSTIKEDSEEDTWTSVHPSLGLLGLGIILIELEHGQIEDMRVENDLFDGKVYFDTNRITADRCLKNKRLWDKHPYPVFQKAVSACIEGVFPTQYAENEEISTKHMQMAIYDNVTQYLEHELFTIDKKLATDTLNDIDFDLCIECPSRENTNEKQPFNSATLSLGQGDPLSHNIRSKGRVPLNDAYGTRNEYRLFDSTVSPIMDSESNKKASHAEDFFRDLTKIHAVLAPGETESLLPVKIAVLDTGVREGLRESNNVVQYYDFIDPEFVKGKNAAQDKTGHGSDMVYLIHKTAPHAEIYVARVFETNDGGIGTRKKVALAIKHATEKWKVDIISMSFGFKDGEGYLDEVIQETQNVLMLAASTNFGATENNPVRYPARCWDKVIGISAADGLGHPADFNPPVDMKLAIRNFSTLGVVVPLQAEAGEGAQDTKPRYGSGTSMATPIAAGVAALVLEFSRQEGMHENGLKKHNLRNRANMLAVFNSMAKNGQKGGFHFIAPWKVLLPRAGSHKDQMTEVCKAIVLAIEDRDA